MKEKMTTKTKPKANKAKGKPSLNELAPKKKKKTSFLKILATTIGLLGVASAILMKKEKPKGKKVKSKKGAA